MAGRPLDAHALAGLLPEPAADIEPLRVAIDLAGLGDLEALMAMRRPATAYASRL